MATSWSRLPPPGRTRLTDEKRDKVCYVLSPSYSGTTLFSFLLNTHPRIATIGELKAKMGDDSVVPDHCSCGETMQRCAFWQRVAAELRSHGEVLDLADLGTHFESPSHLLAHRLLRARVRGTAIEKVRRFLLEGLKGPRRELMRVLERNRRVIAAILHVQGGEIFVDSSKDPVRLLLQRSELWDVKVVQLVRDGRATANSHIKWKGVSMKKAALAWRRPHEQLRQIRDEARDVPRLRVHYEELATRPTEVLNSVFAFLGVEEQAADLDFRGVDNHILGNPMRLKKSSDIVLDKTWQHQLSAADLETFKRFGGELNRSFGYHD